MASQILITLFEIGHESWLLNIENQSGYPQFTNHLGFSTGLRTATFSKQTTTMPKPRQASWSKNMTYMSTQLGTGKLTKTTSIQKPRSPFIKMLHHLASNSQLILHILVSTAHLHHLVESAESLIQSKMPTGVSCLTYIAAQTSARHIAFAILLGARPIVNTSITSAAIARQLGSTSPRLGAISGDIHLQLNACHGKLNS
jgi:hypothetical protein